MSGEKLAETGGTTSEEEDERIEGTMMGRGGE